jgi:hypothetical protein
VLTQDVLRQLVVSVQSPYAALAVQVRHLVHVHKQLVGVPTAAAAAAANKAA